jgi:NAD(P)-dependent dehydrogenase (short-subunit alcohol dehydrogenase family)
MQKNRYGSVVNISSVQSLAAQKGVLAYATSKGAINSFTRALSIDSAEFGVRVNAVLPGSVDTPMLRDAAESFRGEQSLEGVLGDWGRSHPLGRIGTIAEIAELVAFLASDRASFITGASYVIDGGLMSQVPVVLPK